MEYTKEEIDQMLLDLVQVDPYANGYNNKAMPKGVAPPSVIDNKEDPEREKKLARRKHVMRSVMRWYTLPAPKDDDELENRVIQFFVTTVEQNEYPTVEKLALACGTTARDIQRTLKGEVVSSPRRRAIFEKAFETMHSFEADLATNFDIQPVIYMFRSKNYFNMADRQEINYTNTDPLGKKVDNKELQKLYEDNIIEAEFEESDL